MKEKHVIDDFELVNRMRKNDQHAFSTLFIKYHSDLLLYCGTLLQTETNAKILFKAYFWNFGRKEQN